MSLGLAVQSLKDSGAPQGGQSRSQHHPSASPSGRGSKLGVPQWRWPGVEMSPCPWGRERGA